jgi:hypothetical protein
VLATTARRSCLPCSVLERVFVAIPVAVIEFLPLAIAVDA